MDQSIVRGAKWLTGQSVATILPGPAGRTAFFSGLDSGVCVADPGPARAHAFINTGCTQGWPGGCHAHAMRQGVRPAPARGVRGASRSDELGHVEAPARRARPLGAKGRCALFFHGHEHEG